MAYSITTLRAALKELGGPGFVWEATPGIKEQLD
jgi:hypothetical protein